MDLASTFIHAGVSLQKVSYPAMKSFVEKYTKKFVSVENTHPKNYVRPIYDATLLKIKEIVGKSFVYVILDDTMDAACFKHANCSFNCEPVKPMFKMYNIEKN